MPMNSSGCRRARGDKEAAVRVAAEAGQHGLDFDGGAAGVDVRPEALASLEDHALEVVRDRALRVGGRMQLMHAQFLDGFRRVPVLPQRCFVGRHYREVVGVVDPHRMRCSSKAER
jgi:hypothetical protein